MKCWRCQNECKIKYGYKIFIPIYVRPESPIKKKIKEKLEYTLTRIYVKKKYKRPKTGWTQFGEIVMPQPICNRCLLSLDHWIRYTR